MPSGTNPNAPRQGDGPMVGSGGGDWIGALINAGAGLYDSYQNRKANAKNTDKTIAANKAEAELAYQRQLNMWNQQNLYNSPAAQMARFAEAGLSPHLMYGQGNAGNASPPPAYQPPDIQYKYSAGNFGQAIASILPTLMSVGTWAANMRNTEAQTRKTIAGTELVPLQASRMEQLIAQLERTNPEMLKKLQNQNSLFPYQQQMQSFLTEKAWRINSDLEQEYFNKWGSHLGTNVSSDHIGARPGSMKELERLQAQARIESQRYQNRILGAKSEWTDFSITDPQSLIQMVLGGVMSMTGQTLRARPGSKGLPHRKRTVTSKDQYGTYKDEWYEKD